MNVTTSQKAHGRTAMRVSFNVALFTALALFADATTVTEAFAQSTGSNLFQPISSAADSVLSFMTGTFAVTVATIVVAGLGYSMFQGMIPWGRALSIIGGIVFIFGSAQIVKAFSSGMSTTVMLIDHVHMLT
jgi:type IV secretory pathway VirB2 component (pilin)